jgi:hypothetical protein
MFYVFQKLMLTLFLMSKSRIYKIKNLNILKYILFLDSDEI